MQLQELRAKRADEDKKRFRMERVVQGLLPFGAILVFMIFCPAANAGVVKVSKSEAGTYTQYRAWYSCTKTIKSYQSCRLYNKDWVVNRCQQKSVYPEVGPLKLVNLWYTVCPLRFGVRSKNTGATHWWACNFRVQRKRVAGDLEGWCQDPLQVIH